MQFSGFNPQQKFAILQRMGYNGSTQEDEMNAYITSRPEAASKIRMYETKAREMMSLPTPEPVNMAEGGALESFRSDITPLNPKVNPASDDNNNFAPNYEDFLKSDFYKSTKGQIAPAVIDPVTINGQTYNFSNPLLGQAYRDYMASLEQSNTTTPPTTTPGGAIGTGGSGPSEAYSGEVAAPQVAMLTPQQDQLVQPLADQQATQAGVATVAEAAQADVVGTPEAATVDAAMASGDVQKVTAATQAVQGAVSQQIDAAQGESSVQNAQAAQGAAIMMNNPAQREIQQGELISGSADAQKAAQFSEQIEAAQASPSQKATVQGQLDSLMQDFEGGETPAWAAGAMRAATAQMAARGLGSSSLAGQAIVQAAMESALPIAMADAQTIAQFEAQNLSNRQQRAMLAAQQRAEFIGMEFSQDFQARVANSARIGEIANMNFTAEQQIALENSRAANTMNLTNLSNDQAMVMSQVAALSQMDMANLNNRQQAAVQNAQNFLQMDLTNLSNEQQTSMFKAQQNIQALFTDQAAENAAQQFNAASDNQVTQFFADLQANVSKFNADQQNAIAQSNVNAVNATQQFNTTQNNAFRQFMISNNLAVAQANAQWRQTAATLNQEAANEANMETAKTINAFTASALDEIWQRERDELDYVFSSYQNDQDRANAIILQKLAADATLDAAKLQNDIATNQTIGKVFFDILFPK